MRIVRTALIIVFILSLGTFGISELLEMQNQDTTLPEITSDREVLEISCDYTEEDLLAGLSAYDETDGDLTSQIIPDPFPGLSKTASATSHMLSLIRRISQLR